MGFGEDYFSWVDKGAIKGWKRHNDITLNLVVPLGKIGFTIFDDRLASASKGAFNRVDAGAANYIRLTVPPGVWVAFQGLGEQNMLLNVIPVEHDPCESDNLPLEAISYPWK